MKHLQTTSTKRKWLLGTGAAAVLIVAGVAGMRLADDCEICEAATTILLQGTVAQNCTVSVTTLAAAASLPVSVASPANVNVGTAIQNCNKKVGYTLAVTSANCAAAPTGAKLSDAVSAEALAYSVQFTNPTTGGSTATVSGLLATACTAATGRDVTNFKVVGENSGINVAFTGNAGLAAGTYTDTLTITMTAK